jgi:tRNA pseudouridine38-40 synthase
VTKKGTTFLETTIPINRIPTAIAQYLPDDISVWKAEAVEDTFHPRYDVRYKEYIYQIWNSPTRDPFTWDRSLHYPKKISDDVLDKMNQAAKKFCGTMDFASYMAADSKIKDTVRTVIEAEVSRCGDMIEFRVCANGFLYNMVRIMTGTLLAVAEGKILPQDIEIITQSRNRNKAGITVPAKGLFLNRVVY